MKNQNRALEVAFLISEAKIVLCVKLQFCSNYKSFHQLISWGTKTIYPILSNFLGILCVQGTILKLMLKVINGRLLLLFENGFSGY